MVHLGPPKRNLFRSDSTTVALLCFLFFPTLSIVVFKCFQYYITYHLSTCKHYPLTLFPFSSSLLVCHFLALYSMSGHEYSQSFPVILLYFHTSLRCAGTWDPQPFSYDGSKYAYLFTWCDTNFIEKCKQTMQAYYMVCCALILKSNH